MPHAKLMAPGAYHAGDRRASSQRTSSSEDETRSLVVEQGLQLGDERERIERRETIDVQRLQQFECRTCRGGRGHGVAEQIQLRPGLRTPAYAGVFSGR